MFNLKATYSTQELQNYFKGVHKLKIDKALLSQENFKLLDLIQHFNIKASKKEARRYFANNSFSINGKRLTQEEALAFNLNDSNNWLGGIYLVLQFGKKEFHLVEKI